MMTKLKSIKMLKLAIASEIASAMFYAVLICAGFYPSHIQVQQPPEMTLQDRESKAMHYLVDIRFFTPSQAQ